MLDIANAALEAQAKLNPSIADQAVAQPERRRIPMSLPQMTLSVPPLPGFYLYWMRGTPERIMQARQAGYDFVRPGEVNWVYNSDLAGNMEETSRAGTDLGDRVSVLASTGAGSYAEEGAGQPLRLYLMKQKWEHHLEDQSLLDKRSDQIAGALTASFASGPGLGGRAEGETLEDFALRHVDPKRTAIPDLFKRKPNRS